MLNASVTFLRLVAPPQEAVEPCIQRMLSLHPEHRIDAVRQLCSCDDGELKLCVIVRRQMKTVQLNVSRGGTQTSLQLSQSGHRGSPSTACIASRCYAIEFKQSLIICLHTRKVALS